jgi:Family of unknown function (DUF6064)
VKPCYHPRRGAARNRPSPRPTAIFTLGLLLLRAGGTPLHLAIIPLLWTLIAGATDWILSIPQDLTLSITGLVEFGLILWKDLQQRPIGQSDLPPPDRLGSSLYWLAFLFWVGVLPTSLPTGKA